MNTTDGNDRTGTVLGAELVRARGSQVIRALSGDVRAAILNPPQSQTLDTGQIAAARRGTTSATIEHAKIRSEAGLTTTENDHPCRGIRHPAVTRRPGLRSGRIAGEPGARMRQEHA